MTLTTLRLIVWKCVVKVSRPGKGRRIECSSADRAGRHVPASLRRKAHPLHYFFFREGGCDQLSSPQLSLLEKNRKGQGSIRRFGNERFLIRFMVARASAAKRVPLFRINKDET